MAGISGYSHYKFIAQVRKVFSISEDSEHARALRELDMLEQVYDKYRHRINETKNLAHEYEALLKKIRSYLRKPQGKENRGKHTLIQ